MAGQPGVAGPEGVGKGTVGQKGRSGWTQSRAAHPAELPLLIQQAMYPAWQGVSMGRLETPKLGAMWRGFAFLKQQQVGH